MNKNLDFLRAFAVLLVAGGHALAFFDLLGPYGPFRLVVIGGLGVLLFFVHTALVLMQSLEREPGAANFLVRRMFRIYPLAVAVILTIVIFKIPQAVIGVHHFSGYKPDFGDILSNLTLTQNFSFRAPILGPTWSLSYEMQMYVLLPLIFILGRSLWRVIGIYAVVFGIAIAGRHYSDTPNLTFFAPCFMGGVLAYRLEKSFTKWTAPAWCWPLFILILTALYTIGPDNPYKGYALCLVLGIAIPRFSQISWPAVTKTVHYIAKYSYGIYLTHFACLYFAFEKFAGLPVAVGIGIFVTLFAGLPIALYHLIEEPLILMGKRITRKQSSSARNEFQVFADGVNAG